MSDEVDKAPKDEIIATVVDQLFSYAETALGDGGRPVAEVEQFVEDVKTNLAKVEKTGVDVSKYQPRLGKIKGKLYVQTVLQIAEGVLADGKKDNISEEFMEQLGKAVANIDETGQESSHLLGRLKQIKKKVHEVEQIDSGIKGDGEKAATPVAKIPKKKEKSYVGSAKGLGMKKKDND